MIPHPGDSSAGRDDGQRLRLSLRRMAPPLRRAACGTCRPGPYTPRTNGKAERFIQLLLHTWAFAYPTSAHRTQALVGWLRWCSRWRPHGSLGGLPPLAHVSHLVCSPRLGLSEVTVNGPGRTDHTLIVEDRYRAGSSRPARWPRARTSCRGGEHEPISARQCARGQRCRRVPNGGTSERESGDRRGEGPVGRGRAAHVHALVNRHRQLLAMRGSGGGSSASRPSRPSVSGSTHNSPLPSGPIRTRAPAQSGYTVFRASARSPAAPCSPSCPKWVPSPTTSSRPSSASPRQSRQPILRPQVRTNMLQLLGATCNSLCFASWCPAGTGWCMPGFVPQKTGSLWP